MSGMPERIILYHGTTLDRVDSRVAAEGSYRGSHDGTWWTSDLEYALERAFMQTGGSINVFCAPTILLARANELPRLEKRGADYVSAAIPPGVAREHVFSAKPTPNDYRTIDSIARDLRDQ